MTSTGKRWKEAASVILLASTRGQHISQNVTTPIKSDYRVLLLTRNHGGSFAGAHVFPGGTLDKADFSTSWLELFRDAGYGNGFGALAAITGPRPPMLLTDHRSALPNDIALRICAIRETFEESGVLLLKKIHENGRLRYDASINRDEVSFGSVLSDHIPQYELENWRHRVHEDAFQFVTLCKEFQCVPDIWALAEWSNWLTPVGQPRRYDTMFYTCCLSKIPKVEHDKSEMIKSQWAIPEEVLHLYYNNRFKFAGPQLYQLLRLARFPMINDLHEFIQQRAFLGCERNCPKVYILKDGAITTYAGDDLYPKGSQEFIDENLNKVEKLSETIEESRAACRHLHRMEIVQGRPERDYRCNVEMPCGHITPRQLEDFQFISQKLLTKL